MILQANYTRTRSYQGLKGFLPLLKNLIFHRFAVIKKTPDERSHYAIVIREYLKKIIRMTYIINLLN